MKVEWVNARSHSWLQSRMRSKADAFAQAFIQDHGWARDISLEERFTDTGISVKLARVPPYQVPQDEDKFLQRDGHPGLVVRVVRDRDSRTFECGVVFLSGNQTADAAVDQMLETVKKALEAAEKQAR